MTNNKYMFMPSAAASPWIKLFFFLEFLKTAINVQYVYMRIGVDKRLMSFEKMPHIYSVCNYCAEY